MTAATVKRLDPTQVELEIAISDAELAAAQERAFRQLVKSARIPGFRPGKAPRKIFEAQYGSALIENRAMEAVVPEAYSRALEENDLEPVDEPQMELLPLEDGQPLRVRATVTVRPQIDLGTYKGLELEGPTSTISEHEVDSSLEMLRQNAATLVPADRPVALGDTPTLDYEGKVDGVPFEGGKAENSPTEIAEGRFIRGFVEGIAGMAAGETKDVEARFPDDYSKAELAGKTAVFTVTVRENKIPELPPLDDALAQRFGGETATLEGLRSDMRRRLEDSAKNRSRRTLTTALMDKLLEIHEVPLPEILVEREVEGLLGESKSYIARADVSWEDYLAKQGKTEAELRDATRPEAEKRVKAALLIEAIAKAEKVEATRPDIEAEVASLSRQYNQPPEQILEMLRPNFGSLVNGIVRSKTIDLLLDAAKVTETAPADPAPSAPGDEAEATNSGDA
ncbi:MAG: trigger factor [Vulcanimicrobiaceae bacterium]